VKTIETTAVVLPDHTLTIQLPPEISPGEHRVVVMIDDDARPPRNLSPLRFTHYAACPLVETMTFRREDIYDDAGR
jgi:hypothetical protein